LLYLASDRLEVVAAHLLIRLGHPFELFRGRSV
jgi:hypothetical protein